jgi:hypothetical protein
MSTKCYLIREVQPLLGLTRVKETLGDTEGLSQSLFGRYFGSSYPLWRSTPVLNVSFETNIDQRLPYLLHGSPSFPFLRHGLVQGM